jgi:hypothetical protein
MPSSRNTEIVTDAELPSMRFRWHAIYILLYSTLIIGDIRVTYLIIEITKEIGQGLKRIQKVL